MVLPQTLPDREYDKFEEVDGLTTVRIKGTNFSGSFSITGLQNAGKHSSIEINSSTWTLLSSDLSATRNSLVIQNNTGQNIKINYAGDIVGFVGVLIRDQSERSYDIKGAIAVYAKCESGTANLDIEELS